MKDFSSTLDWTCTRRRSRSVAEGNGGEVRYLGEIANTAEAIEKLVRQLRKNGAAIVLL